MPIDKSRPLGVALLRKLGMEPDPWQVEVLDGDQPRLLLNCSRQAGKSTVVAMLGLAQAIFVPGTKVLLVSRSHRQSKELFGIVAEFYRRYDKPMCERLTSEELRLWLANGGRWENRGIGKNMSVRSRHWPAWSTQTLSAT